MFTLIDEEDLPRVRIWSWHASLCGKKWRVSGYVERQPILLHRYLLNLKKDDPEVDHINRNPLDNRKINLRIVTRRINKLNRDLDPRNKSGYRGVSWNGYSWTANAWFNYCRMYLGSFSTPKEASIRVEKFYGKT